MKRDAGRASVAADRDAPPVLVERLVPGGHGFGRLADGRAAFVPGSAPGDRIQPRVIVERRGYVEIVEWSLLESSIDRVAPACPFFERCGGCDWMHLAPQAQRRNKVSLLREAFRRTARIDSLPEPIDVVTAGKPMQYRRRARFHIDDSGRVGFVGRGSHEVVEVSCLVVQPAVGQALEEVRALPSSVLAAFREVEIRHAEQSPHVTLRFFPRDGGADGGVAREAAWLELRGKHAVTVAGAAEPVEAFQRFTLTEALDLHALPGAFTQVNWEVNQRLVQAVVEGAIARGVSTFADLYAGAGNFTLPLLAAKMTGVAVERDGASLESARHGARAAGLPESVFVSGDVGRVVRRWAAAGRTFDLVVLDPPRTGARSVIDAAAALRAPHVAFCACDPVTLARDAAVLVRSGYRIVSLTVFDMFPQTHHFETLAWLER